MVDINQLPLELVNIRITETNQYAVSAADGSFSIYLGQKNKASLQLEFSLIGYQRQTKKVMVDSSTIQLGSIVLKELNLSLETIEINAKRNYEGSSNSSLIIGRDMIEQIPALSINDLLNQIPNRKITPPSLQTVQNVNLRGNYNGGIFQQNNSFGVAIVMDGNIISNNANMQSYNPGNRGIGNSTLSLSSSSYGLSNANNSSYSGDYAFGGIDLRQIPAENIESIEIVAGVPSARYGDLTDGAIIVERQAGKTPAYLRMQLRDNATSYGYSQGFRLSPEAGDLNIGLNYVNSFADNRDKMKAYRRLNVNTMWTNTFGKDKRLKNTFSFDYGRNLDGIKKDPDDTYGRFVRFNSWNLSLSNRTSYRFNHPFFKNLSLNLRYGQSHQVSYTEQYLNYAYILYSDAVQTGIWDGVFDKGIYTSVSHIDGRPTTFSATTDLNSTFHTGKIVHNLNIGANYSYAINNGLGRVVDPSRPRPSFNTTGTNLSSGPTERYYDFSLVIPQKDFGVYAEDVFKFQLFGKDVNSRIGLRFDAQNGYYNLSPRTNVNYQLNKQLRLGLAYGLAFKSPGLGHLYPGPAFVEIPLLNSYNGNVNESRSLFYIYRYDPTSSLRSFKSETFELSALYRLKEYTISVAAYHKASSRGINTVQNYLPLDLPVYRATFVAGQKPLIEETGRQTKLISYHHFNNRLKSDNQGVEVMIGTPKYEALATSFQISGGITRSYYFDGNNRYNALTVSNTAPEIPAIAVYQHNSRTTYFSTGRITSTTHIPKISLMVQLIAEFSFINKTIFQPGSGIPMGYYQNDGSYIDLPHPDPENPLYKHLFISAAEQNESNQLRIYKNYHLNVAKEIKKRFKFAFNVYNFFNYQPRYLNATGTSVIAPNTSPTFGAELSIKL